MNRLLTVLLCTTLLAAPLALAKGDQAKQDKRAQMRERFGITEEQRQQMHKIRQEGGSREEIRAVLTQEQRDQMRQWRKENPDKGRHKGKKEKQQKLKRNQESQPDAEPDSQTDAGNEQASP